jgi:serine/threonine protein kinase
VKVVDWGNASCSFERMTVAAGSPSYFAPEVLKASVFRSYTSACDAFSLGVLIYLTLSASHPFTGSTPKVLTDMKQEKYLMSGSSWDAVSSDAN